MTDQDREALVRRHASGDISWHDLREPGFDTHVQVPAAQGEPALRPTLAAMEGPGLAARQRGRDTMRKLLRASTSGNRSF